MVLKRLFGGKENENSEDDSQLKTEIDEVVEAVEASVEQDAQVAEAISDKVEQSVEQREQEAKGVAEETERMANQGKSPLESTVVEEKKKLHPEVRPHAFVVMPFGKKKGGDGSPYDFNAIYQMLIKPALELAGFEPFRADEATASGDILTDMFQELLLADLVIADLSIDNANAFYELGIRHAFRKRGVVHIQAGRAYMPFDIFNVRTLPYHINSEGAPDPNFLEQDIQAIARLTHDTWASDRDAIHSPIFNLLTGLGEPDQKALRTPLATGFWREYNEWKRRVTIAQRQKRIGDILLLTEEISNTIIKEEAVGVAGKALANMGRNELALAQYRKGLEINPDYLPFRREEAFHLNRIGKVDEAIVKIESILADHPDDGDSIAYLGRIYKEMWTDSWKWVKDSEKRLRTAFESYHWLTKSYQIYVRGFRTDLDQFYPGINALTLGTILVHLADKFDDKDDPDPEIAIIREDLPELAGTLEFALEIQAANPNADYWALVSLAELQVMTSNSIQRIVRAYRKAMTASRRNLFFIESSIQQLEILQSLEMRPEYVSAAIQVLKEERARIHKEEYLEETEEVEKSSEHNNAGGRVFLFSGYSLKSLKGLARYCNFPDNIEEVVRREINRLLDEYEVTSDDLAITAGMAAGGDLIFIESCVARNIPVGTHMPVPEPQYVRDFVSPAGEDWVERFYKMRNHHHVDEYYQTDLVGNPKTGDDIFERNNRWALYSAMARGVDNLRLIALFDDKHGVIHDAKDNNIVRHMIDLTRDAGGQVEIISPSKLILSASITLPQKKRTSSKKKEMPAEKTQEPSSN
jgi:tetratricopeptide (TPR) repeat protein